MQKRETQAKGGKAMIETKKIIQSACYILQQIGRSDKLKLVKLLYLADKCHLIRYGRTITGDEYWAMDYGPVGSTTKDILTFDEKFLSHEYKYATRMLKKVNDYDFEATEKCTQKNRDFLSDTDIEVLEFIIKHFGNKNKNELIKYTHRYPEWSQFKQLFDHNQTKRERIQTEELLSTLPDDPFNMTIEHLKESRLILTGISE
jgi:uncharacterized phage-associated protein